jgi:hypothetical protein
LREIESRVGGREALAKLLHTASQYSDSEWLAGTTISACYWASGYTEELDSFAQLRKEDKEFRDEAAEIRELLVKVYEKLGKHAPQFDMLLTIATRRSDVGLYRRPHSAPVQMIDDGVAGAYVALDEAGSPQVERLGHLRFARSVTDRRPLRSSEGMRRLLLSLVDVIKRYGSPRLGHGPWLHRSTHGCLHFPSAIDTDRTVLPSVDTMLHFNLAFLFRKASTDNPRLQSGEPMPESGKSHWDVVAALSNVVLRSTFTAEQARDRVRKLVEGNPGIGLMGWPAERDYRQSK